jgi:hypothetical protein
MIPWIVSKVEQNEEILLNLNDPSFRDKNTTLMRLYSSACYAVKTFLSSTITVFRTPEGFGFECGIFGILMSDRAVLKSDSPSYSHEDGFTIDTTVGTGSDSLMPLPFLSVWGKSKMDSLISSNASAVSKIMFDIYVYKLYMVVIFLYNKYISLVYLYLQIYQEWYIYFVFLYLSYYISKFVWYIYLFFLLHVV